jgi:hypothetical protein
MLRRRPLPVDLLEDFGALVRLGQTQTEVSA